MGCPRQQVEEKRRSKTTYRKNLCEPLLLCCLSLPKPSRRKIDLWHGRHQRQACWRAFCFFSKSTDAATDFLILPVLPPPPPSQQASSTSWPCSTRLGMACRGAWLVLFRLALRPVMHEGRYLRDASMHGSRTLPPQVHWLAYPHLCTTTHTLHIHTGIRDTRPPCCLVYQCRPRGFR